MKHHTSRILLPLLLILLCLPLSGCLDNDPLAEDVDTLDGLIGAEGLERAEEEAEKEAHALTSFSLPVLTGETLDPITCRDGLQQTVLPLMYEGLFALDETFTPREALCEGYTFSPDFLTWTFTLRSGVKFSDGSPLTAADAAASLERARGSVRYGARFTNVDSIRADSDTTLTITLKSSNSRFPALLDIPIVSRSSAGNAVPVGTGPYVYTRTENGTPYLAANESWWCEDPLPLKTIHLLPIEDESSLAYQFSSRAVQLLVTDLTASEPLSLKGNIAVTDTLSTTMHYIGFNCTGSVFSDPALRRAVSLGIYRENICSAYFSSHVQSAEFPVAPTSPWYPEDLALGYSSEAFAKAMDAAGYHKGVRRTVHMLVCDGNNFRISAAKAIAASLSVHDLNVVLKILPYEDYIAALHSRSFDLYYGEVRMTPDFDCSALCKTDGALNFGGFTDPILNANIASALSSSTAKDSANEALFKTFQSDAPIAVIGFQAQSVVLQGGAVDEITPTCANPFYQLSSWQIHIKGEPTNG